MKLLEKFSCAINYDANMQCEMKCSDVWGNGKKNLVAKTQLNESPPRHFNLWVNSQNLEKMESKQLSSRAWGLCISGRCLYKTCLIIALNQHPSKKNTENSETICYSASSFYPCFQVPTTEQQQEQAMAHSYMLLSFYFMASTV